MEGPPERDPRWGSSSQVPGVVPSSPWPTRLECEQAGHCLGPSEVHQRHMEADSPQQQVASGWLPPHDQVPSTCSRALFPLQAAPVPFQPRKKKDDRPQGLHQFRPIFMPFSPYDFYKPQVLLVFPRSHRFSECPPLVAFQLPGTWPRTMHGPAPAAPLRWPERASGGGKYVLLSSYGRDLKKCLIQPFPVTRQLSLLHGNFKMTFLFSVLIPLKSGVFRSS